MKNPEKPNIKSQEEEEQEKIRIGNREIPVTHEDIDLKEFTRRLNEKEPVQIPEGIKEEGVETKKEEAREEAEKAFEEKKELSLEEYVSQKLPERLDKKERELSNLINEKQAEKEKTGKKLSQEEIIRLTNEYYLKESNCEKRIKGSLFGRTLKIYDKERGTFLMNEKGKPLSFRSFGEMDEYLKTEKLPEKEMENLKREWAEGVQPEKEPENFNEYLEQNLDKSFQEKEEEINKMVEEERMRRLNRGDKFTSEQEYAFRQNKYLETLQYSIQRIPTRFGFEEKARILIDPKKEIPLLNEKGRPLEIPKGFYWYTPCRINAILREQIREKTKNELKEQWEERSKKQLPEEEPKPVEVEPQPKKEVSEETPEEETVKNVAYEVNKTKTEVFEEYSGEMLSEKIGDLENILRLEKEKGRGKIGNTIEDIKKSVEGKEYFVDGPVAYLRGKGEVVFIGDLHGDAEAVASIVQQTEFIEKMERGKKDNFLVFLGDYGDRGEKDIATIERVIALKLHYPENVILLRGNHEEEDTGMRYGLYESLTKKYGETKGRTLFENYNKMIKEMPNIVVTENGIVGVHGGIPNQEINSLKDLNNEEILYQMRWNDPTEETAERVNSGRDRESGTLKLFGEEAFKRFMEKIGGKVMIRSHEYFPEGKDLKFNGRLATIFSNGSEKSPSSGYKDRVNQALFMEARLDQSKEKFLEKDFQPVLYEEILYEKITEQTLEERKPETKPEEAKSKEEKEKTEAIEVNPQQKEVAKEKKVKTIDWLGKGLKDIEERRIPTQITNKLEKYLKMHGVRRSEIKTMRPMDAWEKAKEIYEKERGVPVGA